MKKNIIKKYKIKEVFRESKRYLKLNICIFLIGLIGNIFSYIYPYLQIEIVDNALTNKNFKFLVLFSIIFLVVSVLEQFFTMIYSIVTLKIESKIEMDLRLRVLDFFMEYDNPRLKKLSFGKIDSIIRTDISSFQSLISDQPVQIILNMLNIIIYVVIMIKLNICLTVFVVLSQVLTVIISNKQDNKMEKEGIKLRGSFLENQSVLNEIIHWITKIRVLNAEDFLIAKYKNIWNKRVANMKRLQILGNMADSSIIIIRATSLIFIYIVGGYSVIHDKMSLGMLLGFIQYTSSFSQPIHGLISVVQDYRINISEISDVIMCLDNVDNTKLNYYVNKKEKVLELQNVTFKYKDIPIMNDISAIFKEGELNCIRGRSGIGKSTLFKLLCKFEIADNGTILYGNNQIKDIKDWYRYISYYPQESIIFNDTIYNNITLGKDYKKSLVEKICKDCCIYNDIMNMKDGFESVLLENGKNISEGQKQRIALARTLISDAPIIMLDEPTSCLDKATEKKIWRSLLRYSKDKIVIVITHTDSYISNKVRAFDFDNKKLKLRNI